MNENARLRNGFQPGGGIKGLTHTPQPAEFPVEPRQEVTKTGPLPQGPSRSMFHRSDPAKATPDQHTKLSPKRADKERAKRQEQHFRPTKPTRKVVAKHRKAAKWLAKHG
jgi:hypothetical protein